MNNEQLILNHRRPVETGRAPSLHAGGGGFLFVDWGLIDYREAWDRQRALAAQIIAQKQAGAKHVSPDCRGNACVAPTGDRDCRLPTATADCRLPTADCAGNACVAPTGDRDCLLPTATADCPLPTADCPLPTADCAGNACVASTADRDCRLPTATADCNCPLPTVIFCEHPHVYTLGRHGKAHNLLVDAGFLQTIHAAYYHIDRGGDITYHGPGQIVCYPVLDLEALHLSLRQYIFLLEETVIRTLQHYGVAGGRLAGAAGVWIDAGQPSARKICAIGVHASHYVTTHGFAFNINTDLTYYRHIHPCGFTDKGVTSLAAETGRTIDLAEVKQWLQHYLERSTVNGQR